jgi:MFS family permease
MDTINWKRNVYILAVAEFVVRAMMMMIRPYIAFFLPELGVTDPSEVAFWTGLLSSINFMAVAIFTPIWGGVADSVGRKPMVLRCIFFTAILSLLLAFSQNPYQFLAIRFFTGAFSGLNAAATTLVATTTPEQYMSFAIGIIQTGYMAGTLIGPILGSLVSSYLGYRGCLFFAAITVALLLPFVFFGVKEVFKKPAKPEKKKGGIKEKVLLVLNLGNIKGLVFFIMVLFLSQFAMQGNDAFNSLYVKDIYNGSHLTFIVAVSFGILAGVNVLTAPSMGKLADKKGNDRVMNTCLVLYSITIFLQVYGNIAVLFTLRAVQGLLLAGIIPCCYSSITKMTQASTRGVVLGLAASFVALGSFLGPNICGIIAAAVTIKAIFVFLGALTAIAAAAAIMLSGLRAKNGM